MTDQTKDTVSAGWKDAFQLRGNLLQPDVYAFEKALQKQGAGASMLLGGGTVNATHMLVAAIEAGWVEEPETVIGESTAETPEKRYFIGGKGIHEMSAGVVLYYGAQVSEAYREAVAIPPN